MKTLDVAEVCAFLKLKKSCLYGMVKAKAIPCMRRPGSRELLFDQEELEEWLRSGRLVTLEEATARLERVENVPSPATVVADVASASVYHRNKAYG